MNFLDIGIFEIMVVLIVALLVIGPQRLPEVARKMGKIYRNLKRMTGDFTKQIKEAADFDEDIAELKGTFKSLNADAKEFSKAVDTEVKEIKESLDAETEALTKPLKKEAAELKKTVDTKAKEIKEAVDTKAEEIKKPPGVETQKAAKMMDEEEDQSQ